MKRLLTFETFVPRHIEKRLVDLEKLKVHKNNEFKIFVQEFQHNLKHSKNITAIDPKEQLFIDLLQPLIIITSQSLILYLFNAIKNDYVIQYDWNDDTIMCQSQIWKAFKAKFDMSTQEQHQLIAKYFEKYFKIKPTKIIILEPKFGNNVNY